MNGRPFEFVRVALVGLLVMACSGPILANPTLAPAVLASPSAAPSHAPDPQPIVFPRDEGPHDRLTEWWYYTGHLEAEDGHRLGFEAVVFRAERSGVPVTWASHLAITDETGGEFRYAQRAFAGPAVDRSATTTEGVPEGFTLIVPALDPATGAPTPEARWQLSGSGIDGAHHVVLASLTEAEAAAAGGPIGLDLELITGKPPALHGGIGWIDFGPAGSSYYYSRTRFEVGGIVTVGDRPVRVAGTAWFDHQWGDFISVGAGGWDWFAVNLDDGTDLTISLVRAADGSYPLVYGTLVDADGRTSNLDRAAFTVEADPARTWTSPATGARYPAGWTIRVPDENLVIGLRPTVADQELDTRATTGVAYWEGSQVVTATRDGKAVRGEAYVELTGYAPKAP
jgi:predicted secreted hydrolase